MRKLLGMLFVALAYNASAFEIRPIGLDGGAYDERASGENFKYLPDDYAPRCSNRSLTLLQTSSPLSASNNFGAGCDDRSRSTFRRLIHGRS